MFCSDQNCPGDRRFLSVVDRWQGEDHSSLAGLGLTQVRTLRPFPARRFGSFSEQVAKLFCSQIISGLQYLHSRK
jgi:serine/threonine protein kinase